MEPRTRLELIDKRFGTLAFCPRWVVQDMAGEVARVHGKSIGNPHGKSMGKTMEIASGNDQQFANLNIEPGSCPMKNGDVL